MKLEPIAGAGAPYGRAVVSAFLAAGMLLAGVPESRSAAATVQEPSGRFRVLVVPLESEALDDDFGEKVAEQIRKQLEDFPTHAPVGEKEYERALKRYEIKKEDLNQIKARQLANLMGAQVVFWGAVSRSGNAYDIQASFIDVKTGDEVSVPTVSVQNDKDESAGRVTQAAMDAFEQQVKFVRARQFCADYVGSQQPDNALRNCNEALGINPNSVPALFNKAMAFRQKFEADSTSAEQWADSAVKYFEMVLEQQPGHRDAMNNAAYVYTRVGRADRAGELYQQYLELDPGNVPVRLKVAYDLAQADLMEEAIEIIQDGIQYDSSNVDLLQALGDYSLRYSSVDSSYVPIALDAYEQVLEIKGEETDLSLVENALAAYTRSGQIREAIGFAQRALQAHPESARLWSLYADALAKAERFSDAVTAMDSVLALDESYSNGYLRRGRFKLEAGNEQAALADFRKAIDSGTSNPEDVFRFFWAEAHSTRDNGQLAQAVNYFEKAAEFAQSNDQKREVEFWWGYTYYQMAEKIAEVEEANLSQLQRAQSLFQSAQAHFQSAGDVRKEVSQFRDATQKWLLNIEARIKRASRASGS